MAAVAESLLKTGEVSAMIRQGFISSPHHLSPSSSPPPFTIATPTANGGVASVTANSSPPSSSFPSPRTSSLFEMISQEDLCRRTLQSSGEQKRRQLQERISAILAMEGPGDVELSFSSGDGYRVSMVVHRRVLAERSQFFEEKLAGVSGRPGRPVVVEICECEDVEAYMEVVGLLYSGDLRLRLAGEQVDKVLGLLKVSVDIKFDDGIASCLEYLEATPWPEAEEEKVVSVLRKLQLQQHEPIKDVLQRVLVEPSTSANADSIFFRIVAGVLKAKDKKARREMKALIAGLLREDHNQTHTDCNNKIEISREALYHFCRKCLNCLFLLLSEAASIDQGQGDRGALMGEVSREVDNVQWLVEILLNKRMADEFVSLWADQTELANCHSKIPCMYRYEISTITAQLCIAIGRGQILVSKDARISFLRTWLEALYEDFGWMRRACRMFDRKMVEDGLCATILTLPMTQQQEILLRWFDCFLNKGDECPNIQRAFEVWWRRAFVRQYMEDQVHSQFEIVACHNPTSQEDTALIRKGTSL